MGRTAGVTTTTRATQGARRATTWSPRGRAPIAARRMLMERNWPPWKQGFHAQRPCMRLDGLVMHHHDDHRRRGCAAYCTDVKRITHVVATPHAQFRDLSLRKCTAASKRLSCGGSTSCRYA